MTIFKCPHCRAEYELLDDSRLISGGELYNCQQCWKPIVKLEQLAPSLHFTPLKPEVSTPARLTAGVLTPPLDLENQKTWKNSKIGRDERS